VAVFQFVIKPNSEAITNAVEQIIADKEFIEEFEIEDIPEDLIDEALSGITPDDGQKEASKPVKPRDEYKNTYDYIKDNVDSADFEKGVAYAARIDIVYVMGLLKDGLTVPEKKELKAYLKERFTNEEIKEGIALYKKYSYLLK
ncbi:MAG: hypothetical protein IKK18_05435, partial [Clostridia bacterium]|nr:hypothetical protein [Clostridia bacterium]